MSIIDQGDTLILGETTGIHSLSGPDEFHWALSSLARQAHHSVKIFSQELDHDLYDNSAFIETLSDTARRCKNLPIRILLKDPSKAAHLGHRLVELQRRLPSFIEMRNFPIDVGDDNEEFVLFDNIALLKRYTHGYMRGYCEYRAIPDAGKKARYFDLAWDQAEPCHELRRLTP